MADVEDWSYPRASITVEEEDAAPAGHQSLVALVRNPRMVVEYLPTGQNQPYVRGTFIADDDVDELLRQTEPKGHDSWQRRITGGGVDPDAPEVATAIQRRIRRP
ncbi:MAG: hypothetical protein M5U31_16265 [Acidimicrobiia bacterium]|nr:hypothetical protein [Acidimicrobiia bacterium]